MKELPEDVGRFIRERVESVGQLETLLLLHRTPDRDWTAADVARDLYTAPGAAAAWLADLHARGLLTAAGASYRRGTADVALINRLAALYHERRVAVISMIYAREPH